MAIRKLLEGSGLGPNDMERLHRAYQIALHALLLVDRDDPITEMIARKVIEVGGKGGSPFDIAKIAVKALGVE